MSGRERNISRSRIAGAYISSVISISLVLLLVGVGSLLLLNARNVADYFKESVQISLLFKQEVSEKRALLHEEEVKALPFVKSTRFVGREEGTEELKAMLGDDFLSVFETSPVPISLEITLNAEYVSPDSLDMIIPVLENSSLVDEVNCQQSLVEALNANIARISLVLGVFIVLMLFISFVLINNTVRLSVFDRRFSIHTMKMVGATLSFIRGPFLVRAVWQGLASSALALVILAALLLIIRTTFTELFAVFTPGVMFLTALTVVLCGVLICLVSTFFVVGKLMRLGKDELYS